MQPALHLLSLGVRDLKGSARFYDAALAALGFVRVWSDVRPGQPGQAIGYGHAGQAEVRDPDGHRLEAVVDGVAPAQP